MESVCKNCDRHEKEFPNCLDECERLKKFQNELVYVSRGESDSFDVHDLILKRSL